MAVMWLEGKRIFADARYYPRAAVLGVLGVVVHLAAQAWTAELGPGGTLFIGGSAIVLAWVGGFILFFGRDCAKAAVFPLGLLMLMIPLPTALVEPVEIFLQRGSAEVTHFLFKAFSTPVYRDGLVFSLPGINIEVAKECSGIRSAIGHVVTALPLGYVFLRSNWRRSFLVTVAVPIAIFKNGVRIATLSWLGVYVSDSYLNGGIHHRGGGLFSAISFALLLLTLWVLRKQENRKPPNALRISPTVEALESSGSS
jgi:exosortase